MRGVKTSVPIASGCGALVVLLAIAASFVARGPLGLGSGIALGVGGALGVGLAIALGVAFERLRPALAPPTTRGEPLKVRVVGPRTWDDDGPPAERQWRPGSASVEASLARITHEVRTPLNALLGYVELLQEDSVGEAAADLMRVRSAALQVLGIVTSALDLQRLHDGTYTVRPEAIPIHDLAREVADSVRIEAEANGNRLLVTTDPGLAPSLDRRMVRSILFNLAANACQYTANGTITLEARAVAQRIHLVVTDSGIGMSERQIEELFGGSGDGVRPASGPGYGVALARGFTEVLGGKLSITSSPGRGTRVIVDLPLSVPARR